MNPGGSKREYWRVHIVCVKSREAGAITIAAAAESFFWCHIIGKLSATIW
jgi:hypothetical protein